LLISFLLFGVGVTCLILSAKFFTQAAESIGLRWGLSPFVVGVVIVSIGTSLPELISSIVAVAAGTSEVVAGNVIGSSVSNILFVLGLTAWLARTRIDLGEQYLYVDLHFLLGTALIVLVTMYDGKATLAECLLGLLTYVIYMRYLIKSGQSAPQLEQVTNQIPSQWVTIGVLVGAGIAIFVSAKLTISSLVFIADGLGVSKAIIAVTLLSIGTTLPECVVSVTAARAGKADLAVGNVLGSCIFNGLVIPGIAACFGTLIVPTELINFPLPAYLAVVLFFYLLSQDKKISQYEGALLLMLYVLFVGKISQVL
jgi:cation:H+ antiporter